MRARPTSSTSGSPSQIHQLTATRFGRGIGPELATTGHIGRQLGEPPFGGEWWEHSWPLRHYRATDVLDSDSYAAIRQTFNEILDATDGDGVGRYTLKKLKRSYSARVLGINDELAAAFAPLFAEERLRSVSDFLGLEFVPRVEGALHSNPAGSETGWIHTDLCSGWFDEAGSDPDTLVFPRRGRCHYFTGQARTRDAEPREYIRAATLIFYLENDGWAPGDGGETGLYSSALETEHNQVTLVSPINNSLLLFECSPHSYHRFVANPGRMRNSIILWLHSEVDVATAKWGTAVNRPGGR